MNFARLLVLPWLAWSQGKRRALLAVVLAIVAVSVIGGTVSYRPGAAWRLGAAHGAAVFNCLFWAAVLSQLMLLAREAHRLRLPVLGREAVASLALYALLSIVMPVLLLIWLGGDGAVALTEIVLGAGVGMAYACLPSWLGVWAGFVPIFSDHAARWLPMPAASPSGFLAWAVPCAAAVWLLIGAFWRGAVRRDDGLNRARKPILLNLRSYAWHGLDRGNYPEIESIRRRWRWLQPVVDLHRCGPGRTLFNLRVAMGGLGVPLTPASRARQVAVGLVSMLPAAVGLLLMLGSDDDPRQVLSGLNGTGLTMFLLVVIGAILVLQPVERLRLRWARQNAELPLLALLPGLGDATSLRRALLGAALLYPVGIQLVLTLLLLVLGERLQMDAAGYALLLLGQFAGAGMSVALSLAMLGGLSIHRGWLGVLCICGILLIGVNCVLALLAFDGQSLVCHPGVALTLAMLWAGFFAPLVRIGVRGWRAFHRRPHPFLPNA
ncbi:MAG: hypothetical protein BGO50_03565 [Rhodanobacter sp. 67-28]|nr:MAG: hypothetical protein BGO50_03565 [Rhodanobacter sp. 67-28]